MCPAPEMSLLVLDVSMEMTPWLTSRVLTSFSTRFSPLPPLITSVPKLLQNTPSSTIESSLKVTTMVVSP